LTLNAGPVAQLADEGPRAADTVKAISCDDVPVLFRLGNVQAET
jgi:hypothetical protein